VCGCVGSRSDFGISVCHWGLLWPRGLNADQLVPVEMSRQPSRARTLTQDPKREDDGALEQGIRGRNIRVLHKDQSSGPYMVEGPDGIMMQPISTTTSEQDTRLSSLKQKDVDERSLSPGESSSTVAEPQPPTERPDRYGLPSVRMNVNAEFHLQSARKPTCHCQQQYPVYGFALSPRWCRR
jgi:hypothetical protein